MIHMSLSSVLSQVTSQLAKAIALYSASALDLATTFCFFVFQETGEFPNIIQNPEVDLLEKAQLAQSESQYAVNCAAELLANKIP